MKLEIQGEDESRVEPDGNGGPSGGEVQFDVQFTDDEGAARSAENIAKWRSYLPESCIDTMISMGWDRST